MSVSVAIIDMGMRYLLDLVKGAACDIQWL